MEDLVKALDKSERVKLSKAHIYVLKNIIPVDEKGDVQYIENSKFLAELVKKFWIHSEKKKFVE